MSEISHNEIEIKNESRINATYKVHRDFAEHENNLINHRMTWFATIQSFLIATFGFSFQKYFEVIAKIIYEQKDITAILPYIYSFKALFVAFAFAGFLTAYSTRKSVKAATTSIEVIGNNWDDNFRRESAYSKNLPQIIGTRESETRMRGNNLSLFLPNLFLWIWIVIGTLTFLLPPLKLIQIFPNT